MPTETTRCTCSARDEEPGPHHLSSCELLAPCAECGETGPLCLADSKNAPIVATVAPSAFHVTT